MEETLLPDGSSPRYATASATLLRHPPLRFKVDADRLELEIMARAGEGTALSTIAAGVAETFKLDDPQFPAVVERRARMLIGLGFLHPAPDAPDPA